MKLACGVEKCGRHPRPAPAPLETVGQNGAAASGEERKAVQRTRIEDERVVGHLEGVRV